MSLKVLNYRHRLTIQECKVGQDVLFYNYDLEYNISAKIIKKGKKKVKILIEGDKQSWIYPEDLKPKRIEVRNDKDVPKELIEIMNYWYQKSLKYVPTGYWVMGAKIEFEFGNEYYEMRPPIGGQCDRWEHCLDEIANKLSDIGCTNIYYDKGYLD